MKPNKRATVVWISALVIVVFLILFAARFIFGGPEDIWMCVNGQWIMHGAPEVSKPVIPCLR